VWDVEAIGKPDRLGPLARTGRTDQNESHRDTDLSTRGLTRTGGTIRG
jgi:hypothetical protein